MTSIRLGLVLLLSGLLCGLSSIMAATGATDTVKRIVCVDGEPFYLNEQETVETANLGVASTDFIIVEKRFCRLTLYRDGQVLKKYPVAIGKPITPTPVGEWKVINKGGKWGGGFGVRWPRPGNPRGRL